MLTSSLDAVTGRSNALGLARADRMVVVLVDGLGAAALRARTGHARTLAARLTKATTMASGFPTTTAAALASLTTGLSSGTHGLVGYRVLDVANDRIVNQLSGWDAQMRPREWQPAPTVFELAVAEGVAATVIGPERYAKSALTEAILRGAQYHPARTIAERFAAARAELDRGGKRIVYLYIPELDQTAHAKGWESPEWTGYLELVDAEVAAFATGLRSGEGALLTADHGVLDVPAHQHVLLEDGPLLEGVRFIAGEPRCLQLHVRPDARDRLLAAWIDAEGSRAWVASKEEMIASGWYGEVTEVAAARMGDIFVAARKAIAYYDDRDPAKSGQAMIGQHGSLTPEELHVPLIGFGTAAFR